MSGTLTQFGIGIESEWGTAVAPTKFYEITKESLKGTYKRVQAKGISSAWVDRADRAAVGVAGAEGDVEFEPLTKEFGNWLYFMMGAVDTTGPTETTVYTHTATLDNLYGKSLTAQVGRANDAGTVSPWTYEGGRVTEFQLTNSYEETLLFSATMDFEQESNPDTPTGVYVLATATLPSGAEVFNWLGGQLKVGADVIDITEFELKVDNKLETERPFINRNKTKKQPIQDGKREITWSFKCDYVNNTYWKKVSSATQAGAIAEIEVNWRGSTLLGSTVYPNVTVTIPMARFDEGGPAVDGPGLVEDSYSGVGLYDGTNSALEIVVQSADTTVLGGA